MDNGLCYYWSILRKNWTAAEDFCQREGGHLASSEALATVRNIVQGMEDRGIALLWLGATDVEEEGNWTWVDGTPFQGWAWGPHLGPGDILPRQAGHGPYLQRR